MSDKAIEAAARAMMEYKLWPGAFDIHEYRGKWMDLARVALSAYKQALWQPIETAPKDGSDILLLMWGSVQIVCSFDESKPAFPWSTLDGPSYKNDAPTHWSPLPPPPGDKP